MAGGFNAEHAEVAENCAEWGNGNTECGGWHVHPAWVGMEIVSAEGGAASRRDAARWPRMATAL